MEIFRNDVPALAWKCNSVCRCNRSTFADLETGFPRNSISTLVHGSGVWKTLSNGASNGRVVPWPCGYGNSYCVPGSVRTSFVYSRAKDQGDRHPESAWRIIAADAVLVDVALC